VTLDEFHGDGGGISNLNAAYISGDLSVSNLTATTLIADSFVGNGSGLTNLNVTNIVYYTNDIADITKIDMSKSYGAISTNNNVALVGLTGLVAANNQVQWATRIYTNTSGSTKTISVPASWKVVGGAGSTVYVTNQTFLSLVVYPGFGTNFIWQGF